MTRDDFLQAILDSPDDDVLRLACADWLEGQGDFERAAFIRVQVELAKLPNGDKRGPELVQREAELLARNESVWVEPLRHCIDWTFQRGFVGEVTVTVPMYQEHAFELLNLAPIRRMWVDGAEVVISGSAPELIPESLAREALALPLGHAHFGHDDCLLIAVPAPIDVELLQRLNFILQRNLAPIAAPRQQLEELIQRRYKS